MSPNRSPAPALLWRARLRLAALSLLVMGGILYGAGFAMARLLLQEREAALRRELQALCAARAPKARWQWSEPPRHAREIRVQTFPLVEEQDLLPPASEVRQQEEALLQRAGSARRQ